MLVMGGGNRRRERNFCRSHILAALARGTQL